MHISIALLILYQIKEYTRILTWEELALEASVLSFASKENLHRALPRVQITPPRLFPNARNHSKVVLFVLFDNARLDLVYPWYVFYYKIIQHLIRHQY